VLRDSIATIAHLLDHNVPNQDAFTRHVTKLLVPLQHDYTEVARNAGRALVNATRGHAANKSALSSEFGRLVRMLTRSAWSKLRAGGGLGGLLKQSAATKFMNTVKEAANPVRDDPEALRYVTGSLALCATHRTAQDELTSEIARLVPYLNRSDPGTLANVSLLLGTAANGHRANQDALTMELHHFVPLLSHADAAVVAHAALAIGQAVVGHQLNQNTMRPHLKHLVPLLMHADAAVRAHGTYALGQCVDGNESSQQELEETPLRSLLPKMAADDTDEGRAARWLALACDHSFSRTEIPQMMALLTKPNAPPMAMRDVLLTLGLACERDQANRSALGGSLPTLVSLVEHDEPDVVSGAMGALVRAIEGHDGNKVALMPHLDKFQELVGSASKRRALADVVCQRANAIIRSLAMRHAAG